MGGIKMEKTNVEPYSAFLTLNIKECRGDEWQGEELEFMALVVIDCPVLSSCQHIWTVMS